MGAKKLCHRHSSTTGALQFEDSQGACSTTDINAVIVRFDDLAGQAIECRPRDG